MQWYILDCDFRPTALSVGICLLPLELLPISLRVSKCVLLDFSQTLNHNIYVAQSHKKHYKRDCANMIISG